MGLQAGHRCERARGWVSLRVDGELSQLESALLDAHLGACAACAAFAHDVTAATAELRAAALQALPGALTVSLPRRHGRALVTSLAASAALLAALIVGGTFRLHSLVGGASLPKPTAMISSSETQNTFRNLRRLQLIAQEHPIPRNKSVF